MEKLLANLVIIGGLVVAGVSVAKAFPAGKPADARWLALAFVAAMASPAALYSLLH